MKKLLLLFIPLLLLCGCQPKEQTQTAFFFDTVVTVTLPHDADPSLFDKAWAICADYQQTFDRFSEKSELSRLSTTPTIVSEETAEVLTEALRLKDATNGAFDIRLGRLSDLWNQETLPDADAILNALKEAQDTQVVIDGTTVTLIGKGQLDLGGIAKGYVTDRLAELFHSEGCESALLNLGGNVYCLGTKQGKPFRVGIDTLMDQPDPPILALSNQCAVTAGVNQRYKIIDGVRYHHILNPQTGVPAKTDLISATIVADSATLADALSTACIVLGQKKAEELLKQFPDVSAVLVSENGTVTTVRDPLFVNSAQK